MRPNVVIVFSVGRTGTSLLMDLLSRNERVFSPRKYPFETRFLLSSLMKSDFLQGIKKVDLGVQPDYLTSQQKRLYRGSFGQLDSRKQFEFLWECFCKKTLDIKHKVYLEKSLGTFDYTYLDDFINRKYIVLVRDPRDIIVSMREFNKRKINSDFYWKKGMSDYDFSTEVIDPIKTLFIEASLNKSDRVVVKYEDLIEDRDKIVNDLFSWMGVEFDSVSNERMSFLSKFRMNYLHKTTPSNEMSFNRWRNELSEASISYINDEMGVYMSSFGYEV